MIQLKIQLGGKRLDNTGFQLKVFWPQEYSYSKCNRLNLEARRLAGNKDHEDGCYYHPIIEKK